MLMVGQKGEPPPIWDPGPLGYAWLANPSGTSLTKRHQLEPVQWPSWTKNVLWQPDWVQPTNTQWATWRSQSNLAKTCQAIHLIRYSLVWSVVTFFTFLIYRRVKQSLGFFSHELCSSPRAPRTKELQYIEVGEDSSWAGAWHVEFLWLVIKQNLSKTIDNYRKLFSDSTFL